MTWAERANQLRQLMLGINAKGGIINCSHVALRLDEHFRENKNLNLPPVPIERGNILIQSVFKQGTSGNIRIVRSSTDHSAIIERCSHQKPTQSERFDLTDDTKTVIEIDEDFDLNTDEESIHLRFSTPQDIISDLRHLPKRKAGGTAYGFIVYRWDNDKNKCHIANFFVDENNEVFFLDAQPKDPNNWITATPPRGYRPELFYLQSIPPEGLVLKQEPQVEAYTRTSIHALSQEAKDELLDRAEKHAIVAKDPEKKLTPAAINELAAAAFILFSLKPNEERDKKLFAWAKITAEAEHLLGVRVLIFAYLYSRGVPAMPRAQMMNEVYKLLIQHIWKDKSFALANRLAELFHTDSFVPQEYQASRYKDAINIYMQILGTQPNNIEAVRGLASIYQQGKSSEPKASQMKFAQTYLRKLAMLQPPIDPSKAPSAPPFFAAPTPHDRGPAAAAAKPGPATDLAPMDVEPSQDIEEEKTSPAKKQKTGHSQ